VGKNSGRAKIKCSQTPAKLTTPAKNYSPAKKYFPPKLFFLKKSKSHFFLKLPKFESDLKIYCFFLKNIFKILKFFQNIFFKIRKYFLKYIF